MSLKQVKCQCCLKTFDKSEKVFKITDKVKTQFKDFTQLKVRKFIVFFLTIVLII